MHTLMIKGSGTRPLLFWKWESGENSRPSREPCRLGLLERSEKYENREARERRVASVMFPVVQLASPSCGEHRWQPPLAQGQSSDFYCRAALHSASLRFLLHLQEIQGEGKEFFFFFGQTLFLGDGKLTGLGIDWWLWLTTKICWECQDTKNGYWMICPGCNLHEVYSWNSENSNSKRNV